jgi:hypothetical protein
MVAGEKNLKSTAAKIASRIVDGIDCAGSLSWDQKHA